MYDRGLSVLEQYGLTAKSSYRGRGALLCQTEKGLLILREFRGSAKRLEKQREFLLQVQKQSGQRRNSLRFEKLVRRKRVRHEITGGCDKERGSAG